jgi:hypothetical protein
VLVQSIGCGPSEMEDIDVVFFAQESQIALPIVNRGSERYGIAALGVPLTGIEGLEGCSQWNFMPRSDLR